MVGVWGAEQTWFISALLICYGVTPLISRATEKINKKCMFISLSVFPMFLLLLKPAAIGTLLAPVCLYAIAYLIGNETLKVKVNKIGARLAVVVICLSFGLRFILRIFFDGTVIYSGIVATYTHYVAALAVFYLFAWFFAERKPARIVTFFGAISFEVYLYHYMFTVGPISLFNVTPLWTINCILVFGATLAVAIMMHYIGEVLEKKIFSEMR